MSGSSHSRRRNRILDEREEREAARFDATNYGDKLDNPEQEQSRRVLFNPYDEVPLKITAEAVRAVRLACIDARNHAEGKAANASSSKVQQTWQAIAQRYAALAEELARALDDPGSVQVGRSLGDARREQLARDIDASK